MIFGFWDCVVLSSSWVVLKSPSTEKGGKINNEYFDDNCPGASTFNCNTVIENICVLSRQAENY